MPWRRTSRIHRGELFGKLANLIQADIDQLATLLATESGKVVDEAGPRSSKGCTWCSMSSAPRGSRSATIAGFGNRREGCFHVRRKPRGVVAVITPWNFPFAVPLWMLAPSLLEGNTVVFKPSEETPAIGEHLIEVVRRSGLSARRRESGSWAGRRGGRIAGRAMPDVDVVCFTGSYDGWLADSATGGRERPQIVAIETGCKSAVIVCEDAPLDLACDAAILSAFKTTGQRCVSAGRVLVHARLFDAFAEQFVKQAKHVRFGDPLDANELRRAAHQRSRGGKGRRITTDWP